MKFTGLALAISAFTAGVASQGFGDLPKCAQSCATDSIPSSCGLNIPCICGTSSFITGVSCCIAKSCSPADQEATIQFADKLCAGAGVTNLPTAAVCSSAASATETQSQSQSQSQSQTQSQTAASATTSAQSTQTKASSTTGTSASSASAASSTSTGAAASFGKTSGGFTAGVMGAAMFAAMCLA